MNRLIISLISLLALTLTLQSCHSSRSAIGAPDGMSRELKAARLNVDPLDKKQSGKWLSSLASTYTPWQHMTLNGSVSLRKLPIHPSVKIYMERGRLLLVSLRVPILGEVGRVEITPDSAIVINRKAGCYNVQPASRLLSRVGVNLTDLQDLLLGRVFLAGSAPLSKDNVDLFNVSAAAGGNYIVSPRVQRDDAEYGFTLYPDGKMLLAVAFTTDEACLLQGEYTHEKSKTSLTIDVTLDKKNYTGTLSYGPPDMKSGPMQRTAMNAKWKKVSLKEVLTSF